MARMSRTEARKLLNEIRNGNIIKCDLEELAQLNHCSSSENFAESLKDYAFSIKGISTKSDANNLKRELMHGMPEPDLNVLYRVNNISSVNEALFELDKVLRKRDMISAYKQRAKAEAHCISSGAVNFLEMLENRAEIKVLYQRLREELKTQLQKIDNEKYQM